jgi:hypothetical protein
MTTNIDQLISELQTLKNSKNALKGILDNASTEQMIVDDTGVSIGILKVESVSGKLVVNQSVETPLLIVSNNADIKNLRVNGTLTADTLYVKKIISEQPQEKNSDSINFYSQTTVDDKGIYWSDPNKTRQFVFKQDLNGFYSSESINLAKGTRLSINGVSILEEHNLGQGVLHSNLRTIGKLEKLTVNGDSLLGETLFVNSTWSRVGIGTDKPNAALSIVDNLTELAFGADENGQAFIGTWNNTVLNLVTDNTTRISIKNNIVEFGSITNKNSIVKVHGTLEVDNIISNTKIEKTGPIEFLQSDSGNLYYTGMVWKSKTENKRFMLMPSPDRLLSSEHIELAANKNYIIGNNIVLSQDKLGSSVLESSLTKLGRLSSLEVDGNVNLSNTVVVENNRITFNNPFTIKDGLGVLVISSTEINSSGSKFTFKLNGSDTIKIEETGNIVFGNKNNTTRKINAYGQLAVNITNPDSSVSMAVEGDVQLNNKKFSHGHAAPQTGQWKKADIVWNTEPQDNGFVGWICVVSGSPGIWKPFGHIIDR